nr:Alpha beta hydrolase fold-3 domain protein [uncultured bacterium]
MKVTNDMILPELRLYGKIFKKIMPSVFNMQHDINFNPAKINKKKYSVSFLKGKCSSRSLIYEQKWIKRPDGSDLRICLYLPKKPVKKPVEKTSGLLWIHGGGYSFGTPELEESFIKRFIAANDCVVVSPDYRLSIDAPYPAALEDCYTALLWLNDHCDEYNIRKDQLIAGGDSAGGGLTAALCLYARDKKEVKIAFQMPLYPMLDDRNNTESIKDNDAPVWNEKANCIGWKMYLGSLFETQNVPCYAAPARAADFSNLPPAISFVGGVDPFRDETITFMDKLKENNIPVHFKIFEGCFHSFDFLCTRTKAAKQAVSFLMDSFKYAAENYFAE